MSPTPSHLNPSQAVERIREIIVGRQLERLEGRVACLEADTFRESSLMDRPIFEDRLLVVEAKIEALQGQTQRLENSHQNTFQASSIHREDAQRLALHIQQAAQEKAEAVSLSAVGKVEDRLGVWLTDWQKSLQVRLEERDEKLIAQVKADLEGLREGIRLQLEKVESQTKLDLDERLEKLAHAARALADSVSSVSTVRASES